VLREVVIPPENLTSVVIPPENLTSVSVVECRKALDTPERVGRSG